MTAPTLQGTEAPPARTSPPWTRARYFVIALVVVTIAALIVSWRYIGMGVLPLFTGIGDIFRFLGQCFPPDFYDFPHTLDEALITVCMAIVGTALAAVLGLIVGFLAARNTTPHPAVRWLARGFIVLCRSMPDLVFAIIFVQALGVGILPGVLALGFHSVGMLGKLYAEAIEQVPTQPREAVRSTGAGPLQNIATSVWPQVMPAFSSVTLYRLDINLRSAVILGYVGAGGIGLLLEQFMETLQWQRAIGIVLVMFVLIVLMEYVSAQIRRSLIGDDAPAISGQSRGRRAATPRLSRWISAAIPQPRRELVAEGAVTREVQASVGNVAARKDPTRPPWTTERVKQNGFALGAVVLVILSLWATKINPITAVTDMRQIWDQFREYFPPDFSTDRSGLFTGVYQSVAVAVVATVVGLVFAIPIGLAASRNVAGKWTYRIARAFLVIVRAVPELILAIVFVVAVGLGLVAGAFALIVGTVGFLSKLVADGIEEVNPVPREAVLSAGAAKIQETVTSVILPAAPAIVGNSMYMLDVNFRSSTILGLVGAGGLGFLLYQANEISAFRTVGAIIILTFAVVLIIEIITNWLRKQVI
jgi:phosphonate transport system permease protein